MRRQQLNAAGILARTVVFALAAAIACAGGCRKAPEGGTPTTQPGHPGYDKDIADAWTVAQAFCEAWKAKDLSVARSVISSRLLERHNEDAFASTIVGPRNRVHKGFELTGGRKLSDGRVAFDLLLRFDYRGGLSDRPEKEESEIVLVNESGAWRVDGFPIRRVGLGV